MKSIVTANAGSGKTYLLANRLIRWMIQHARANDGRAGADAILAITFTRKAAGEILERVLGHLALGATDDAERTTFADPGMIGPATAEEYGAVLSQVLAQLDRLSIGTIDSFFSRVARAFAAVVGLPEDWTIGGKDHEDSQRAIALSRLLESDPTTAWQLIRQASAGAPKASIHDSLLKELDCAAAFHDQCDIHGVGIAPWEVLCANEVVVFPGERLATAEELHQFAADLSVAALPLTKQGAPNANWVKARHALLELVTAGNWPGVLCNPFAMAIHTGATYSTQIAGPDLTRAVSGLLSHAMALEARLTKQRISAINTLGGQFRALLNDIRRADRQYSFAEIAASIARANGADAISLDEMRYRLDCAVRDLAIDECQDTSPEQYSALSPIIEELLAADEDRQFLMVGDPKQSIFGWRGGTPSLIGRMRAHYTDQLEEDVALGTSYRSNPGVMRLVNQVFGPTAQGTLLDRLTPLDRSSTDPTSHAAALEAVLAPLGHHAPAAVGIAPVARVLTHWSFVEHTSAPKLALKPSIINAWSVHKGIDWADATAEVVAARAAARPDATIAVLVRTNKQVTAVVEALRRKGVSVSDEGAGALTDAMAVVTLMALLRVADQPGDTESMYLATRPSVREALAPVIEIPEGVEPPDTAALSRRVRRALHARGLRAWLADAAREIAPICVERDRMRLEQLLALADAAPADVITRPERFVRMVEATGSRTVSGDRIRVMTIHASKGLEFEEVVLPSMGEAMDAVKAGPGEWSMICDGPGGAPLVIGPIVSKEQTALSPLLSAVRTEARVGSLSDGLSLLYVAITRAKSGLHFICEAPTQKDELCLTPLWVLRQALPDLNTNYTAAFAAAPVPSDTIKPLWSFEGATSTELDHAEAIAVHARAAEVPTRRLPAVASATTHEQPPTTIRVSLPESFGDPGALRRGTLVHALLRQVQWTGQGSPQDGLTEDGIRRAHQLVQAELRSPVSDPEVAAAVRAARAALSGPIGKAMARPTAPVNIDWSIHGELPYQRRDTRQARAAGRMDRVVLGASGGRITQAHIIDFKTGSAGDSREEILEHYGTQMSDYRDAMCEMTGLVPTNVAVSLLMIDRGEVIDA
ncbi:MAG: UvrD-helicase domain-containing protein [Planctomycetota bacterium]|nr:UvrD-helicase domain-containing protein [Planctomycetota bacterium]MDA1106704.1 UvrD-helicase domain-containing protein [Planctomycetota bacterium]